MGRTRRELLRDSGPLLSLGLSGCQSSPPGDPTDSDDGDHPAVVRTEPVAEAVDTVRERFPEARIDLTAPESVSASAHHQFGLVVIELIENAIQCHPEADGAVEVSVRSNSGAVEVAVRDSCPPIPEQEIQVLTGQREMEDIYHTSGLGLWLVYWVVHRSDGAISFDRNTETGNTVTVALTP